MKKFLTTTAIALAMVGSGAGAASANWGQGQGMGERPEFDSAQFEEMRAEMEARQEAMQTAIQSGFQAWHDLVSEQNPNAPILATITADNFAQFQEMHSLMNQARGLQDQARQIGEGLGLQNQGMGQGMGMKMGGMGGKHEGRGGSCPFPDGFEDDDDSESED